MMGCASCWMGRGLAVLAVVAMAVAKALANRGL